MEQESPFRLYASYPLNTILLDCGGQTKETGRGAFLVTPAGIVALADVESADWEFGPKTWLVWRPSWAPDFPHSGGPPSTWKWVPEDLRVKRPPQIFLFCNQGGADEYKYLGRLRLMAYGQGAGRLPQLPHMDFSITPPLPDALWQQFRHWRIYIDGQQEGVEDRKGLDDLIKRIWAMPSAELRLDRRLGDRLVLGKTPGRVRLTYTSASDEVVITEGTENDILIGLRYFYTNGILPDVFEWQQT